MSDPGSQAQPDDAMVDLLVKQVTEGLSPDEQRALDVLDSATVSEYLRDLERAAAAVSLAVRAEALPPALKTRLQSQAQTYLASGPEVVPKPAQSAPRRVSRGGNLGWLAAAASLLLAVFGWLRTPPSVAPVSNVPATVAPEVVPKAPPTAAEERQAMLAKEGALKITLGATKDPAAAGVTGDVVWDPAAQQGYIRFHGLAPNDPRAHQYQVWIFDGGRDQRYPVDGGVFDVPANSTEVVIPIHAALLVHKPAAFAVTVEKPGGVVVSARDHVVALGTAG